MPGSFDEPAIGFQLWINLKSDLKFCEPEYQEYKKDTIPLIENDGVKVKLIAGEAFGVYFDYKVKRANQSKNTNILFRLYYPQK